MTANLYEKNNRYHVSLTWNENGKRKRKSVATGITVKGNNKRKALCARDEILDEWKNKIAENHQEILFSDYLIMWLEIIKLSVDETTHCSYKKVVSNQICPYFAKHRVKLHELEPHHIQDFYTWKMTKAKRKVTANTIRRYHANIHRALADAVKAKRINYNPASKDHITLPKAIPFKADFYTVEELHKLLEAVKGHKIETPVYLASWFGLRRGEVLGLRWQDVDFNTMTLFLTFRVENIKRAQIANNSISNNVIFIKD